MAARKKDGAPDWKYYESAETVALFEPVKQYLLKNCKKVIIVWIVVSLEYSIYLKFCSIVLTHGLHEKPIERF